MLWRILLLVLIILPSYSPSVLSANHAAEPQDTAKLLTPEIKKMLALHAQGNYLEAIRLAKKIFHSYRKRYGEHDKNTFLMAVNLATLYIESGQHNPAEKLLLNVLTGVTAKDSNITKTHVLLAWNSLGNLYHVRGQYKKALKYFQDSLALMEQVYGPDYPEATAQFNNIAVIYEQIGKYNNALKFYDKALRIATHKAPQGNRETIRLLCSQATTFYYIEDFSRAEQNLLQALTMAKKNLGLDHPDIMFIYNNLSELYSKTGQTDKALTLLGKALDLGRRTLPADHPDLMDVRLNIATLFHKQGDFRTAEKQYKKILALLEEKFSSFHPLVARALNNLATLYDDIGQYEKALPLYQRALNICRKTYGEYHRLTLSCLNNLGTLHFSLGNFDRAQQLYQQVLAARKQLFGPNSLETASSCNNLASLLCHLNLQKNSTQIKKLFNQAIAIRIKKLGAKHADTLKSKENLGFFLLQTGEHEKARKIFQDQHSSNGMGRYFLAKKQYKKALSLFQKSALEQTAGMDLRITSQIGLGLCYEGLDRYEQARHAFKRAIDLIEKQWEALPPSLQRYFLDGYILLGFRRLDAYEGMLRVLYRGGMQHKATKMLRYAEQVKSRSLLSMLAGKNFSDDRKIDPVFAQQFENARLRLRLTRKRINNLAGQTSRAAILQQDEAKRILASAQIQYNNILATLRKKFPLFLNLVAPDSLHAVDQIQTLLNKDSILLEFYIGTRESYAWVIDNKSMFVHRYNLTSKQLSSVANNFFTAVPTSNVRGGKVISLKNMPEFTMSSGGDTAGDKWVNSGLAELYEKLIRPICYRLNRKNLVIIPHGILHKMPLTALYDATRKKFMIDDFSITTAPSSTVLLQILARDTVRAEEFVGFANPVTKREALHFAERETRHIALQFPKHQVFLRKQASETKLKTLKTAPGVLHFACHGEFLPTQPLHSALLLSSDDQNDGRLEVKEILDLDLRGNRLVTLSACETASSVLQGGDDLIGLTRGFLYSGAPSLLGTLWKVDDQATEKLMEGFYSNWLHKGMDKATALRLAQLQLKNSIHFSHPYFWAAFTLIGNSK